MVTSIEEFKKSIASVFEVMDMDGNKQLDRSETFKVVEAVMKASGKEMDMDSFDEYMAKMDKNKDSLISREELENAAIEIAKQNGVLGSDAAPSKETTKSEPKPVV